MKKVSMNCGCEVRISDEGTEAGWSYCGLHGHAHLLLSWVEHYRVVTRSPHFVSRIDSLLKAVESKEKVNLVAYEKAKVRPADTTSEMLAFAVIRGEDDALPALVDRLLEKGKLPCEVSNRAKEIEAVNALRRLVDGCHFWGGMSGTGHLDDAEEFLEKYDQEKS